MHYGLLDLETTCDGKQENGKLIDDGRMKCSKREIISVGFVVCDDAYHIKDSYSSLVKPIRNAIITDYCEKLTGITQEDVNHGKGCNDVFGDIREICERYSVDYIFAFGNVDKFVIIVSARWYKKKKEKSDDLFAIAEKILDVRPTILRGINCKDDRKTPGLCRIAEGLGIQMIGEHHNALNDAVLLYEVCKKLNVQVV